MLCSTQDGKLTVAANQQPSGDFVIENICKRKFPFNICERSEEEIEVSVYHRKGGRWKCGALLEFRSCIFVYRSLNFFSAT